MKDNGKKKTAWPQIHQVTDNLYISDIYAAQSAKKLDEYDITHIISLLSYSSIVVPAHVQHLKLDVLDYDDENILGEFDGARQWIDRAIQGGGHVLIHCQAGISRSSTILCAYLMASQNIPRDEAFAMIQSVRKHVKPNPGFWEQLLVWEQCAHKLEDGHPSYEAWKKAFYKIGGKADPGDAGAWNVNMLKPRL